VVARSKEAKQLGIKMGAPFFQVRDLLAHHHGVARSSHFRLYGDLSKRVMAVLSMFSPQMEVYSIDEAFLDFALIPADHVTREAQQLRQTVRQWTGIPVSIGIASTKTLAKAATHWAKKDPALHGVLNWRGLSESGTLEARIDDYLAQLSVEDVWGVGRQLSGHLRAKGIHTALALKHAEDRWILKRFSIVLLRTVKELRGESCLPLNLYIPPQKSIICSRSFGKTVETLEALMEAVATYTARAAERLRQQKLQAKRITVTIRTNRFRPDTPQYQNVRDVMLPIATDYTPFLVQFAQELLTEMFEPGFGYHKVGVVLTELMAVEAQQQDLFVPQSARDQQSRVMLVMDRVNREWGEGTVRFAREGFAKPWLLKSTQRSDWHPVYRLDANKPLNKPLKRIRP
jgi:DNA polymerase V